MKKTLLLIVSAMLGMSAGAQTVNVLRTDGTTVSYPASEVSYIYFTAKEEGGTAPAAAAAVDLGLPSGTKWANMNVGASKPEDYGLFFAWGDPTGYGSDTSDGHDFGWASYNWCNGSLSTMTKYCAYSDYGTVDNKAVLDLEDDAAYVNWGSSWCMPTYTEIQELLDNTTKEWTTVNGVDGGKFTSKTNGNSIFLPAAGNRRGSRLYYQTSLGNYWSSSLSERYPYSACNLYFGSGSRNQGKGLNERSDGYTVRPVLRSKAPAAAVAVDLGLPSGTKWANMNVGATSTTDYGLYFAWGETTGYTSDTSDGRLFDWDSYKWYNGSMTKYCTDYSYGTVDNKTVLDLEDDAAYVNWGSDWRMPTYSEIYELLNNTTSEWTTVIGVKGYKFTSKTNGNSIFLPAAGYRRGSKLNEQASYGDYWSSSLDKSLSDRARVLDFYSEIARWGRIERYRGFTVRPVLRR